MLVKTNLELLKKWDDVEKTQKAVIKSFGRWWFKHLDYVGGTRLGKLDEIFGFPYTSSGMFAELGCRCNSAWRYRDAPEYTLGGLAVSVDGFVVAYFDNDDCETLYVIIDKLED